MTNLRRKRLLLLATRPHNHKRWYSQYCKLMGEGLVMWTMGTAFLTEEGYEWLRQEGYNGKRLQPPTD
jgi:hypothetical protein